MREVGGEPAEDPREAARDGQVTGEAPPPQQEHGDHEESDGPQCGELVEDQEEGARPVRDRVEELDHALLGEREVTRVVGERYEQHRGNHHPYGVGRPAAHDVLGLVPRGPLAHGADGGPDRVAHPRSLARPRREMGVHVARSVTFPYVSSLMGETGPLRVA